MSKKGAAGGGGVARGRGDRKRGRAREAGGKSFA